MAMLAESKSKNKWILNPRRSNVINEMQFGRKMLEKMGWQSGDGLGVNKQGTTEPLRVQYKNDVKGIGYKKNLDNEWLKVEDEYSKFLQNLSSDVTSGNDEKNLESLEKKSEGSKARLHYRKFTRNKDLSRYTEKDLSCILGRAKTVETPEDETKEENGKFFDKGNMNNYFDQMAQKKFIQNAVSDEIDMKSADQFFSVNEGKYEKVKSSKKKKRSEESIDVEVPECNRISVNIDGSEEVNNGFKRQKHSENELENCMEGKENGESDENKKKINKLKKKKKFESSTVMESLESKRDQKITESDESHLKNEMTDNDHDQNRKKAKSKKRKFYHPMESNDLEHNQVNQEVNEGFSMKSNEENRNESEQENKRMKKKLKLENLSQDFTEKTEQDKSRKMDQIIFGTSDELESNRKDKKRDKKKKSVEMLENSCATDGSIPISNSVNQNENPKYRKKKSEEINETEAIINVQIQEKYDNLRIGKDSRRKEKNKWKKRKHNDSKESSVSEGSSEETSAASCDNSPDGRSEKTKLKKDKNQHDENILIKEEPEEVELFTNSRIEQSIYDSSENGKQETPNKPKRKVRFDHFRNPEKDLIEDSPPSEGLILNEKGKSKKSKKQKLDEVGKTENFDESKTCKKEIEMEQTEVSSGMLDDQVVERKSKSNKKLKSKIKVEEEEYHLEEAPQRPRLIEEKKAKPRLKCENQILENETEEPFENLVIRNIKVEHDSFSDNSVKKIKKKSKNSEILREHKDQIFEDKTLEINVNVGKVKVEDTSSDDNSKKKNRKLKKSNVSGEDIMETQLPVQAENEIISASSCNFSELPVSGKKLKRKKCEETLSPINDNCCEDSGGNRKSKSKKPKLNHEKDEVENNLVAHQVPKMEVSLNVEKCSLNSNNIEGSEVKPSDKKAKLLALLEKTTKDDSDDSDNETDSNSVTNVSKSCFKGSNFEQIPGYHNRNST